MPICKQPGHTIYHDRDKQHDSVISSLRLKDLSKAFAPFLDPALSPQDDKVNNAIEAFIKELSESCDDTDAGRALALSNALQTIQVAEWDTKSERQKDAGRALALSNALQTIQEAEWDTQPERHKTVPFGTLREIFENTDILPRCASHRLQACAGTFRTTFTAHYKTQLNFLNTLHR